MAEIWQNIWQIWQKYGKYGKNMANMVKVAKVGRRSNKNGLPQDHHNYSKPEVMNCEIFMICDVKNVCVLQVVLYTPSVPK